MTSIESKINSEIDKEIKKLEEENIRLDKTITDKYLIFENYIDKSVVEILDNQTNSPNIFDFKDPIHIITHAKVQKIKNTRNIEFLKSTYHT